MGVSPAALRPGTHPSDLPATARSGGPPRSAGRMASRDQVVTLSQSLLFAFIRCHIVVRKGILQVRPLITLSLGRQRVGRSVRYGARLAQKRAVPATVSSCQQTPKTPATSR